MNRLLVPGKHVGGAVRIAVKDRETNRRMLEPPRAG